MNILIQNKQLLRTLDEHEIEEMLKSALKDLKCDDDLELSILFTTDDDIQKLNREYRNIDITTDVLSFPMMGVGPVDAIGDIVISIPTMVRQAKEYEVTESERLCRLLIHGLLHLFGYDHEVSKEEEDRMFAKEEELMQKYGTRPLLRKDEV
jgi:probable rRNA maturation factor